MGGLGTKDNSNLEKLFGDNKRRTSMYTVNKRAWNNSILANCNSETVVKVATIEGDEVEVEEIEEVVNDEGETAALIIYPKFDIEYKEEIEMYGDIKRRYELLQENDITEAFNLMKESLGCSERWSEIKYDLRKLSKRGENVAYKNRIEEMYSYLKYVHTSTKATWLKAREDLRSI